MNNQLNDEKVVELLVALGNAYLENGENTKAVEKFKQLYENGVKEPTILMNYASSLLQDASMSDEALQVYNDAIEVHQEDEKLHLSLAKLFLKNELKKEPALLVYRRALSFSPPFEEEIRTAIEKIFQETTQSLTLSEIKETLFEFEDNPELLSIFIATSKRDKKYSETVEILKELYLRKKDNQTYLKSICETLLEQKADCESNNKQMVLKPSDVQFCLKYYDIDLPISRINQIESYLDFKNLFLSYQDDNGEKDSNGEYEFILNDNTIETIEDITETRQIPDIEINITPSFSLKNDFIEKIRKSGNEVDKNKNTDINSLTNWEEQDSFLEYQINTIAIFEIKNYDASPDTSKLPYQTLMKLIASELAQTHIYTLCTTINGIITFCTNPRKMLEKAMETGEKVERYNQVVDDSELIELKTTIHCSKVPFIDLEYQGIKEIRKAIKVHNTTLSRSSEAENTNGHSDGVPQNNLYITKEMAAFADESGLHKTGEYKFSYFPGEHAIIKVNSIGNAPEVSTEHTSTSITKQHFGKYEIAESVAENRLTSTYKGYDPQLERPVLMKVYKTVAYENFKEFMPLRKQFYEEVRKFNRINHPNIGVIYDAGEDGDLLYLVREYIEGKKLVDYIKDQGSNNLSEILAVFVHVCRIVAYYHQNKVWHKNLKPQNIFVLGHDDIKIVDGGLLQVHHSDKLWDELDEELAYVAPEQIKGAKLTLGCDVYQIAVILYELLTGLNPFYSSSPADTRVRIIADDPPPVSSYRSDIPEELDNILIKALLKNPEKRFATIKELELALSDVIQKHDITTRRRLFELL